MLGTGIASAQENVNPDAAPPVVDAGASVPVKIDQNNLANPARNVSAPTVDRTISTDRVANAVPTRTTAPVATNPLFRSVSGRLQDTATSNARGNTLQAHADVPVNVCGNQISALADGATAADCAQDLNRDGSVKTTGQGQAVAGNVVAVNHVLPAQVTGNSFAAGGNAANDTAARQTGTTGGNMITNGDKGSLSGNIIAEQGATPVQMTGNAVGAGGIAESRSTADTISKSYGMLQTSGKDSTLSGNAGQVPLAPLVEVNGNSAAGAGNAATDSKQSGTAHAGDRVWTNGDPATLAGNVAKTPLAGPITLDDNAAAAGGNAYATSETVNQSRAAGNTNTAGNGSSASGNIADTPISLPVAAGGNAASLVGNSGADHANSADSVAGGNNWTKGHDSVLSGNVANVPPATALDVCGNGASGAGQSTGTCVNDVRSETGGYQGTTGNNSVLSGNVAQTPLAAPAELYGAAATVGGQATGSADEVKDIRSTGEPNTVDDRGTVSSNIVTAPTAAAAQVFGDTAGLVGNTTSTSANDTSVTAGDDPKATGRKSSVSGNVFQVPTSTPAQVFGDGVTLVGNNEAHADNATDMKSGGDAKTDGSQSSIGGNAVSAPVASATQVMGWSVGGGGNVNSTSSNDLDSVAGGDVQSTGERGSIAGNLIGAQATPFVPVPGNSVSAAGLTTSDSATDTDVQAGEDSKTSGKDGSVSGNLLHVPANAAVQPYADAIAAAGSASTWTDKGSNTQAGGQMGTVGEGPLSGREATVPAEAAANVRRIPVELVGQAFTNGTSDDTQLTGEDEGTLRATQLKGIELPKGIDKLMGPTEVPAFQGLPSLKTLPVNTLPSLGGLGGLTGLAGQLPIGKLPVGQLPIGKLPVGQLPVGQLPVGQLPVGKLPVGKQLPVGKLPVGKLPVGQLPVGKQLPVGQLPVNKLGKQRAELPLGQNSAANLTPNIQGLPLAQVLNAAQGLLSGAPTQRSVPSLPVTAPALPALPVRLPVPTERSMPTVPTLPVAGPTTISGLKLNPTTGLGQSKERSMPTLPADVPALSMIDPANVFQRVAGTL
ncbi:chaplin family protein [Nocardia sp. NRRL S-836]|uniref:chaplin family protein n=1 Tax=Nocardia sp. NRRL S-836 TaxID=1519492 RepID=UPI0006B01CCB|nr:chaplin family protein [Nocardia sp. NRRL S-836]KOV88867.1 hypothetical protein ADL03_04125 [Nocardia sp. NRRL S-836]